MSNSFLNMDTDTTNIGAGLKKRKHTPKPRLDTEAIEETGRAHGFDRTTAPLQPSTAPRRGRPPLNEDMTYWRIYIAPSLREELIRLRDKEGRRLSDVLADMLEAYKGK